MVALLAPAASAAGSYPTIEFSSGSLEGFAGLNYTSTAVVRNPNAAPMTGVVVAFTADDPTVALVMPSLANGDPAYLVNANCAQAGAGAPIVCGPYDIPANGAVPVANNPTIPSDYLLRYGQTPLAYTATVAAASVGGDALDLTSIAVSASGSAIVRTDAYPMVAMTNATSTSPGIAVIRLIVANGGWSDAQAMTATLTLPADYEPVPEALPDGCAADGAPVTVTCVWADAPSGYQLDWPLLIAVPAGLPVGASVTMPDPVAVQTSTLEAPGRPTSWTATLYYSPFTVRILPPVDIATTLNAPAEPVVSGATVSLPLTVANIADTATPARSVVGTIALNGMPVADLSIDVPGCATASPTLIRCELGTLSPDVVLAPVSCDRGSSIDEPRCVAPAAVPVDDAALSARSSRSGLVTLTLPDATYVDQTLTLTATFASQFDADGDESNNESSVDLLLPAMPLPAYDVAADLEAPVTVFSGGQTGTFPLTIRNEGPDDAPAVTGTIELRGLTVSQLIIDLPGCTTVDIAHIRCAVGDLAAGASVAGSLAVAFPDSDAVDRTLTFVGSFASAEGDDANPANNGFSVAVTVQAATSTPSPTPTPTPDPDPTAPGPTPSPGPSAPAPGDGLASTGASVGRVTVLAVAALLLGAAVAGASMTRRRH